MSTTELRAEPATAHDPDVPAVLRRFIQLATESESCAPLVDATFAELERPIAVVDATGAAVAVAPAGGAAGCAMDLARELARGAELLEGSGWTVRRLADDHQTLGWLVIARPRALSPAAEEVLDVLCALVTGQLGRISLRREVLTERQAALRHRVVTDAGICSAAVLEEARMLQLRLAPAYWPSLAFCRRGDLSPDTLERVALSWQEQAPPGSFAVTWEGASILLYADDREGTVARADVERAVGQMVRLVGIQCPGGDAHAIVGELSVPVERVQAHVLLLRKLRRYATRGVQDPPLVNVRSFALDRLLEHVDAPSRRSFVKQCVGPLIAHDERHGSTLAETLELALEHPRRDDAARAAYMHRNTFRRRLQQALDLVGADLDDPDQRLTLHVALKLHRVSSASGPAARS